MPQSPKAPPDWYTGPTNSEIMQAEVARVKRLLGLDINRLALGSDVEGIITGSAFGDMDFTVKGVNTISFVTVSTSIVIGTQTGATAGATPSQVTGLTVSVIGDNQLNLSWSVPASTPAILNYNVYSSTVNGFTPGSPIASPFTNSYSDTGLSAGTTYYYKVAAVNANGQGTISAQASGTTTGTPPPAGTAPPPIFTLALNAPDPSHQVDITYNAVSFSPAVTSFKVYYSTSPTFSPGFIISGIPGPGSGITSSGTLTPNTLYYFKMSSVNSNGEGSFSSTQSITTAP